MHERPEDLRWLDGLLDESRDRAGAHLQGIFGSGMWRPMSAEDLSRDMTGVRHLAVATVTASGEPRVAPTDGLFFRGRFHLGLPGNSLRLRHLRARPAVSATHFLGDDLAIWMHGRAELMGRDHADFAETDAYWIEVYGSSAFEWGPDIWYVRIDPTRMFAYVAANREKS